MKTLAIVVLVLLWCSVANAVPDTGYMTDDQCRACHGDSLTSYRNHHDLFCGTFCHTEYVTIYNITCDYCHRADDVFSHVNKTDDNECAECHGEPGANFLLHHRIWPELFLDEQAIEECQHCHRVLGEFPYVSELVRHCNSCHSDVDHHEDAAGQCNLCHEDRQKQNRLGRV